MGQCNSLHTQFPICLPKETQLLTALFAQSFLYGQEVHKISRTTEITDLDLYLTDSSDSAQHTTRLPHPTMSLFTKPQLSRYPKLAQGRGVVREKPVSKSSAAGHKAQGDVPNAMHTLKQQMEKAEKDKKEHAYV